MSAIRHQVSPRGRVASSSAAAVATGALFVIVLALLAGGCAGRVSLFPNTDKTLRKTPAQFAADAAKRSYPADLPRGGEAEGQAQVAYELDRVEMVNLSQQDWEDVELWINRDYVVYVPRIAAGTQRVKSLDFRMFYDAQGNSFPTTKMIVKEIELVQGGKVYNLPFRQAD